ncbi:MAG: flagellin [Planctomycetota bacterium]|nr:flagellin [Planctomycetota bacterium]
MGLRINTNIASLNAQKNLNSVSDRLGGNYQRLSSGLRITQASDDAAGLGLSEKLRSKIRSFDQAGRNAQDGISLTQTAEGALQETSNILNRIRELAVQSANGTLGTEERATIDNEVQSLVSEIDRIADTTEFNGVQLLDGSGTTASIQVGINSGATQQIDIALQDTKVATLGVDSIDTTTASGATAALADIDAAIDAVNTGRGSLGAAQNRLNSAFGSIQTARENLSASESRIRDVDFASETAELTRNTVLQQAATSVLQQANTQPQIALSLLRG